MDETKNTNQRYQQQYQAPPAKTNKRGNKGFTFGLISLILVLLLDNSLMLWIVCVISIFGLVNSIRGISVTPRGFAIAGLVLSAASLALNYITRFL